MADVRVFVVRVVVDRDTAIASARWVGDEAERWFAAPDALWSHLTRPQQPPPRDPPAAPAHEEAKP